MKSKLRLTLILFVIMILISTFSFATEATESTDNLLISTDESSSQTTGSEQAATISEDDWISSDVYEIGDVIQLNKIVDGNVFIMAKEVTIDSEIGGDVFVMAQKITITENAYIYSGLFAMANEVNIDGIVCDAYVLANNLNVAENGYVYRDLKASASKIDISGKIRRNADLVAANYNFNSDNGLLIGGDLNYSAAQEITVPEGVVQGDINFNKQTVKEVSVGTKILTYVFNALNNVIFAVVVILLSIWLAPKFIERVSNMSVKKAFASLGIGIAAPIVGIIAIFLVLLSSVASTVAIVAGLLLVVICMSGSAFASVYFGSLFAKLLKWDGKVKLIISCVISALAIWLISLIPFIGGIFSLLVSCFGIGTLITNVISKNKLKE